MTAALMVLVCQLVAATPAAAQTPRLAPQERFCDPTYQDCREDILTYIRQENVEIAMGYWFISDARYSNELVNAWQRGVKIRLLMDTRCASGHPACVAPNDQLAAAGIPMRRRAVNGILHWKMILFVGQGQLQFGGANYAPFQMAPDTPWVNFTDEVVHFTNDTALVQSFMRKFDDLWVSTTEFVDHANITGPLARSFPLYAIHPELNFTPDESFRNRSTDAYWAEQQKIDVMMFRVTDENHTVGMVKAAERNVPVRIITDKTEYRNTARLWHSYNIDKMWKAGVQVRVDAHLGINHAKLVLLKGQGMSIFGSSNWTSPSTDSQREHNMFTTRPWMYTALESFFERKWNNSAGHSETQPFVPLPPDAPVYNLPANAVINVPTTGVSVSFHAGLWAHLYDIYFGTTPNPPLLEANKRLGPSQGSTDYRYYALPELRPGTQYYWRIVSKTMAHMEAGGPVWSFTTAGTAPGNTPPSVSITSPAGGASFTAPASITLSASAEDIDGAVTKVEFFAGTTLIGTDTTAPFSVIWSNVLEGNYTLKAVATDNGNASTTSALVSVAVLAGSTPTALPSGWSNADIGATGATGSATFSNGTFTVAGAGADVWGTADQLHYAYRSLAGDGTIVARVTSIQNVHVWTKVGVMIRNSVSASAAQGFMLVASSAAKGVPFQRRPVDGGVSYTSAGSQSTAPRWVRLVRAGNLVTGSESPDGVTWTTVGSDTFTLGPTVLIGLGVSSHVTGVTATATFDNVSVTEATPPPPPPPPPTNLAPTVGLTSPATGSSFTSPATVGLAASASDSDGTITKVDFYAGAALLGTDTTAPYELAWTNVSAGAYALTAVATDNAGASTTSSAVSISVTETPPPPPPTTNQAPTVGLTSPAAGGGFTAPATIALAASASDSDGTIAKVDFYAGAALLGTDTTAPYELTWTNVSVGAYTLTAVATDNAGASTTSSAVSITVNDAPPPPTTLPAGWARADIGATPIAGDATQTSGLFTVKGSGADIWGTADAFHYAYTTLNGDGTIVARVTTIQQGIHSWVKAGVMIRESLTAGSPHAFMLGSASKGLAFQRRALAGGVSASKSGSLAAAPTWVKLMRNGNMFSAYESADGVTWTLVGTDTIAMGTTVYVGLAVTSHVTSATATATFDNVVIQ